MLSRDLMKRLSYGEDAAQRELKQMNVRPDELAQFCRLFISKGEYWDDINLCGFVVKTLWDTVGPTETEEWIRGEWSSMSEVAKRTVIHAFGYHFPDPVLTTEFAVELFQSRSSDTMDRHLIVAMLSASVRSRHCEPLVLKLVDQIGRHTDPGRQVALEQLRAGVIQKFGGQASGGVGMAR